MSTSTNLKMTFGTYSGDKRIITVPNPKATLDAAAAGACMDAIVTNGGAFADAVTAKQRAELIQRTVTVLVSAE